jgi:thymidine phosphorylase
VVAEIFAALDEEQARIRQLKDELAATKDPARAFELQRAIVAAKQGAEARMLRIQADHARRENRADVAAELEGAIQSLTTPAIGRDTAPRAASAAGR